MRRGWVIPSPPTGAPGILRALNTEKLKRKSLNPLCQNSCTPRLRRFPVPSPSEGYISRGRKKDDARSNQYRVNMTLPLRHPIERHRSVAALVELGMSGGKDR